MSRYENTGCQEANELLKVFLLQAALTDSLTELYSTSLSNTNACTQMHVAGSEMDAEKTMCKLEDPESNYELVDNLLYLLRH